MPVSVLCTVLTPVALLIVAVVTDAVGAAESTLTFKVEPTPFSAVDRSLLLPSFSVPPLASRLLTVMPSLSVRFASTV